MRRFYLNRCEDISGVSGCGHVAEGVLLSDESAVMRWLPGAAGVSSLNVYRSLSDLLAVHGHAGATTIEFVDEAPSRVLLHPAIGGPP